MKQCPKCGTTYTDASLRFCLTDGTPLSDIGRDKTVPSHIPPTPRSGSNVKKAVLVIGITVVLFVFAGIMAALILYSNIGKNRRQATPSPTAAPSRSPSATPNAETEKLKGELANLQKKLEEEKAANANSARQPTAKRSDNEAPAARVDSPNDGFLSLRSEPDADLGERIAKIPHGATVELQNCEKDEVTVAGRRGRWCQVTYDGDTGYVFDAWLVY